METKERSVLQFDQLERQVVKLILKTSDTRGGEVNHISFRGENRIPKHNNVTVVR